MIETPPLKVELPQLLTTRQAARFLTVSESSLRKWSQSGRVPCVRLVGSVRFRRADLEKIVADGLPY